MSIFPSFFHSNPGSNSFDKDHKPCRVIRVVNQTDCSSFSSGHGLCYFPMCLFISFESDSCFHVHSCLVCPFRQALLCNFLDFVFFLIPIWHVAFADASNFTSFYMPLSLVSMRCTCMSKDMARAMVTFVALVFIINLNLGARSWRT